jgi:hypothetical protein
MSAFHPTATEQSAPCHERTSAAHSMTLSGEGPRAVWTILGLREALKPVRVSAAKSFFAPLVFTPLNLAFDRFSQHMRASLKSLQHVIDATECSTLQPQKDAF